MDKKSILDKLSQIDKNKYSISELGLFGSYAKDSADGDSDIDILVKLEFKKGMYQNFCVTMFKQRGDKYGNNGNIEIR